jgi:hypothetical protein
MAGNFSYDPAQSSLPLSFPALSLVVALYDRESSSTASIDVLPNVVCESIEFRDGSEPSTARFRYLLDSTDPNSPFPITFADFWPLDADNPYLPLLDDEVVVFTYDDQGNRDALFDGFALSPQVDLTDKGQAGTFAASGVEVRCWDKPVHGTVYRPASDPELEGFEVTINVPTHFNPVIDGTPRENCTPDGSDVNDGEDNAYPVFLQHDLRRNPDPATFWTLPKLVNYLIGTADQGFEPWVLTPDAQFVYDYLVAMNPNNGEYYDPNDPETFTEEPIIIRDYYASGKAWPDAINEQLGYYGFASRFDLSLDSQGHPRAELVVYRKDDDGTNSPKGLLLQATGATLDPGQSNVEQLRLARDAQHLANQFVIATRPVRYEVDVVLAPGFQPNASDVNNISSFAFAAISAEGTPDSQRAAYRRYIADECGDGHWDLEDGEWVTDPFDWTPLWPDEHGEHIYVERYRPGKGTLISRDDSRKHWKANLAISRDYSGPAPAIWDGQTGTWQHCGYSGWKLLGDRLGIEITADNPEAWKIPKSDDPDAQVPGSVVRGITSIAQPGNDQNSSKFFLKLTTVIESDQDIDVTADVRDASPSSFVVERVLDGRDHFVKEVVDKSSAYYTANPNPAPRDDTSQAQALANALRAAHEFPVTAGSVTIPWISAAYDVGDRIDLIDGIDVSLQTNNGVDAGEAPYYPQVVAKRWEFAGNRQTTTLLLSDHRAEPSHR